MASVNPSSYPEVRQLDAVLNSGPLDRDALDTCLRRLGDDFRKRGRELDHSGGLLNEQEHAARMSLAREDDKLRDDIITCDLEIDALREAVRSGMDDPFLRERGTQLSMHLQAHLNAEASLVMESSTTDVGAGD